VTYLQLDDLPPRVTPSQNRSSVIPYLTYLQQRWEAGCGNAKQLWREIEAQGYSGSYMSVWRALNKSHPAGRQRQPRLPPAPPALSPRQALWLLVKPPEQLTADQIIQREALCDCCAEAAIAFALAQRFGAMIRNRQVDELDRWLSDARTCGVVTLRHFADGLQRDYAAVRAALLLEWSSGQVEGQVHRLKVIKRQMYGRARFDLLRLRVLHPP
jgi:transposase